MGLVLRLFSSTYSLASPEIRLARRTTHPLDIVAFILRVCEDFFFCVMMMQSEHFGDEIFPNLIQNVSIEMTRGPPNLRGPSINKKKKKKKL